MAYEPMTEGARIESVRKFTLSGQLYKKLSEAKLTSFEKDIVITSVLIGLDKFIEHDSTTF